MTGSNIQTMFGPVGCRYLEDDLRLWSDGCERPQTASTLQGCDHIHGAQCCTVTHTPHFTFGRGGSQAVEPSLGAIPWLYRVRRLQRSRGYLSPHA